MIFLDVARFFVGEEKDTAMRIWEASGWQASIGLQSLEKKHLVEVKKQRVWKDGLHFSAGGLILKHSEECMVDCITMHDQLRDMGRYMADKEPSRRRIWSVTKNLSEVQSRVGGVKNSAERDRQVADLRWRQKTSCVESVFNVKQPPQLILLRCYNCPDSSFAPNISTKNLRFLHIEGSNLETLWQPESEAPRELKELYFAGSLTKIPESIGQLQLLEKVVLRIEDDDKLMSFETLPDEFCQLQSLKHLELHQKCLKSLPDSFGELSSLQHVNLAACTCLEMLPGSFANLANLLHIDLSHCQELQLLPDSFGNLTNLQYLDLSGCTKLETLPNTFGNLIQLKFLSLQECVWLTIPSEALGNITTLEHLDLLDCQELPTQLTCQRFLQKLYLSSSELPSDIGKLSNLKVLFIHRFELEMLPPSFRDLRSLEELGFEDCPFKCFPDSIRMLTQLKKLSLRFMDLQQLKITEWLSGLPTTLETLEIRWCKEIMEELTGIERLKSLKDLQIFACDGLKRIHGLAQLTNLQQLDVSMCSELEELPGIEGSQSLKEVNALSCPKLKWKHALHDVAEISGFELDEKPYNGDEKKLVTDVGNKVLKLVPENLCVSQYPTGLADKLKDFEERVLLQQHETGKVKVVGIVGLGGIGKTTLAKEFYNRKQKEYRRSSFLSDVRENESRRQLRNLQRKLNKDLSQKDRDIDSTDEGIPLLQNLLPRCHALIILDDVDCIEQLDALLPVLPAKDSLILVTSRDKKVLEDWKFIEDTFIYTLEGLSLEHSVELFCYHAFHQRGPVQGFEQLVNKFVDACCRLPLSLTVFGALLHGEKKPEHWEEHLLKMSKIPPKEIQKRLEISYESLDDEEQMIFLDVARFFVGEEKDIAMKIWEASEWQASIGLQSLQKKHLVEVKEQTVWKDRVHYFPGGFLQKYYEECMVDCITMHDQLRDMGRYLAGKEPSRRRIWSVTENLSEVQSHVGGIENSAGRDRQVADLRWRQKTSCVESVFNVEQPRQLILLRCYNCPDSSFPPNISTKNLRFLHIEGSNLETLWQLDSQAPRGLRELYIAGSLTKIPESIGQLRRLEKVVLRSEGEGDDQLMSFETLPDEFCQLESLKHLELHQKSLKLLPDSFGDLSSLQHVNLAACTCLEMLPGSFANLAKLLHIDLSHCQELQLLPDSFGNLTNLQHLDLSGCTKLETLPNTFGNLIQLKFLSLQECVCLTIPSEALGNITTLEHLNLPDCPELPTQLTCQPFLQKLYLTCSELPSDIGKLSNLKFLFIKSFELEVLPRSFRDLRSLEELYFEECPLKCFPDSIRMLTQLKTLSLTYMDLQQLKITEWLSGLPTTLETLEICYCTEIMEELTGIERLKSLKDLQIIKCDGLKRIHGLAQLTNLQQLDVYGCSELEELPGIEGSQSLKEVNALDCPKLKREYQSSHRTCRYSF